jgi:K+-sensing histidine kinase KdpD
VWFDFFFTVPYYRFTIRSSSDVTTAVLLLVVGVAVSQLSARARRLKVIAITDAGYLALLHETGCWRSQRGRLMWWLRCLKEVAG